MTLRLLTLALIALLMPATAHAGQGLDDKTVKSFITTMPAIKAMGEDMKKDGKNDIIQAKMKPVPGEKFQPYTKATEVLKKDFPADYKELGNITGKGGFSSQENWAETGDRVMMAYMALSMEANPEGMAAMRQMDPQMLAMMPPEAQAQMKAAQAMAETISAAPAEDKAAVKPHMPELEQAMNKDSTQ